MSAQVHLSVRWCLRPEQADAVIAALQSLMTATRREPGCVTCAVSTEMRDRIHVSLSETWDSEDSLRWHVRRGRFGKLAGLLESAMEQPEFVFALPHGRRGLDYVTEVRSKPGQTNGPM